MTDAGRQPASADWQTWLVLAATFVVGRWLTGEGFGYTLFAVAWAPVAILWLPRVWLGWRRCLLFALLAGLIVLPNCLGRPLGMTVMAAGWLTLFLLTTDALTALFERVGLSRPNAGGLTGVIWTTWIGGPLLMAEAIRDGIGEHGLAGLLAVHPVLIVNAWHATAGDWTHQNVAYAHLTRLGQDIPFSWGHSGWAIALYLLVSLVGMTVPRGTIALINR